MLETVDIGPVALFYLLRANLLAGLALAWYRYVLNHPPRWAGSMLVTLVLSFFALLAILHAVDVLSIVVLLGQ